MAQAVGSSDDPAPVLALTDGDFATTAAGEGLPAVDAAQALDETRLCTVPLATAPLLDLPSPISSGTVEPDCEPQSGGGGATETPTDIFVAAPDPLTAATAAVAGNPTLGWLGWVCSATGNWQESLSASHRRGDGMHLRADEEREKLAARKIREARKQEYDSKH